MKGMHTSSRLALYGLIASLAILPSCGQKEEKTEPTQKQAPKTSETPDIVLASVNGKPLMTFADFDEYLDQLDAAQPGAKMYIMQDPAAEEQILSAMADQQLIADYWIKDKGLDKDPEYQKEIERCIKLCTMQLAHSKFEEDALKDFEITDADVRKYYNENKKRFAKSSGGVKAQEVVFSDEKAANDFLTKAKAPGANFSDLAQQAGKEVKDLGKVTQDNFNVDPAIKSKLVKITKVPSVDLIKVDSEYHVVKSTEKLEPEYQSFDEAKDFAKQMLSYEKFPEMIQAKKEALRKQYKVTINEDYFKQKEQSLQRQLEALGAEEDEDEGEDEDQNNTLPPSA